MQQVIEGKVDRVRAPLVSTENLRRGALDFQIKTSVSERLATLEGYVSTIKGSLMRKYPNCTIDFGALRRAVLVDLDHTDLTFFYYSPSRNAIDIGDTQIAVLGGEDHVLNRLREAVTWLESVTVDDLVGSIL